MTTFKITFFDESMNVYEVKTYHNVNDQSAMIDNIVARICSLQLLDRVKVESSDKTYPTRSYCRAVNSMIAQRMKS